MSRDDFDPMSRRPPPCKCGEAQAARQEVKDNPANPQCHLCRVIAVEHPEWSDAEVARAGAAWWQRITPDAAVPTPRKEAA